jgi:hypothetical protein
LYKAFRGEPTEEEDRAASDKRNAKVLKIKLAKLTQEMEAAKKEAANLTQAKKLVKDSISLDKLSKLQEAVKIQALALVSMAINYFPSNLYFPAAAERIGKLKSDPYAPKGTAEGAAKNAQNPSAVGRLGLPKGPAEGAAIT